MERPRPRKRQLIDVGKVEATAEHARDYTGSRFSMHFQELRIQGCWYFWIASILGQEGSASKFGGLQQPVTCKMLLRSRGGGRATKQEKEDNIDDNSDKRYEWGNDQH